MAYGKYRANLEALRKAIASVAGTAEVRGDGAASFVFAESSGRSVEISRDEHDHIIVERWKAGSDDAEEPVTCSTYEDAAGFACAWLSDGHT